MKCDTCKYKEFHSAGSWWDVAEGNDDPYNYEYCCKGHWEGGCEIPQGPEQEGMDDPWIECNDYEKTKNYESKN